MGFHELFAHFFMVTYVDKYNFLGVTLQLSFILSVPLVLIPMYLSKNGGPVLLFTVPFLVLCYVLYIIWVSTAVTNVELFKPHNKRKRRCCFHGHNSEAYKPGSNVKNNFLKNLLSNNKPPSPEQLGEWIDARKAVAILNHVVDHENGKIFVDAFQLPFMMDKEEFWDDLLSLKIGVVALVRERGKKENDESYKKRMATVESFNAGKFRISVHCYQNQKDIRILMYHLHNRTVGMFPRSVSRVIFLDGFLPDWNEFFDQVKFFRCFAGIIQSYQDIQTETLRLSNVMVQNMGDDKCLSLMTVFAFVGRQMSQTKTDGDDDDKVRFNYKTVLRCIEKNRCEFTNVDLTEEHAKLMVHTIKLEETPLMRFVSGKDVLK